MNVNVELLVSDLERKIKSGVLLPNSTNLDADLRGIIASNQQQPTESAALTSPAAAGNMGALQA